MKFWKVFRFEFGYQIRRPWPWLFVFVLIVLNFLMTRDGSLSDVLYAEFFLNSPFSVAKTTVFGSLIWLVMAAAIAGDAGARDVATGMHPLTYTTSVSKFHYLGGRFLAALVLNALILLAVQVGILLGVYLPGVDASLIGPFRPAAFLTAYAIIALPNAFAATAIQFSLAAKSGRAMAGYFGSFLIVFMGFFVAALLLYNRSIGTQLDPIGVRFIVEDIAHLWTTVEKNRRLLRMEGIVLNNRLLWLSVGVITLAVTYLSFRFAHRTVSAWWWPRKQRPNAAPMPEGIAVPANTSISVQYLARSFGFATHARQMLAIAGTSFKTVAISWGGLALLVFLPLLTVPVVLDQMESRGVPLVPTTIQVIRELTGSLADELSRWVIIPFLIVFFAGELVWRERDAGMGEITDAMPGSDWAPLLGKFLGLSLVLLVFLALQTMAGMFAQFILGYQEFEPGLYLKIMFGLQLTEYLLFALLALVVHVLAHQKYAGHLVAIIAFVFIAMASLFGIEHNLLIYGAGPGWSYTDMRGFGPSLDPWLWFKLYWAAWGLLLAVAARLLWVRGKESSMRVRFRLARQRFKGATTWAAAAAVGLILALGGYIFYNTNVKNDYISATEMKGRQAEYERRFGRFADIPQPRLAATRLHVDIYPERREVEIRGTYSLMNNSGGVIDSIHLATAPEVETGAITFSRPAARVLADEQLHYQIYALKKPLQPGDSLQLYFQVHRKPHGFSENGADASVVENGTSFTNAWLPAIGYQPNRELISASDRREHNLTTRPLIASLYDVEAQMKKGGGRTTFEAVISTDANQIAIAPGELRRTWTEGGRRYFHYSTNAPGHDYAFFSAYYAVHEALWKNPSADAAQEVTIRIYHHPEHTAPLARMVRTIRASLEYYTAQFGPYRADYLNFVERPGNGMGMHAEARLITYAEGFSHWNPKDDPGSLDVPSAVVAHEMAHQWTVPYANVEGAPVMSESIAWYYAMKLFGHDRGPGQFQKLLRWMHEPYRREIRRGEPLLRGLDPYMSYRKGPFALYTISEYVGEDRINGALRRLLEKHRQEGAPLATTLDLYGELKAVTPDSLQYLLHDLFEVNTYWALETKSATAEQTKEGNWQVTLTVQSGKEVVNEAGVATGVPMYDWVEIGILEQGRGIHEPLHLQQHRIRSGEQTITLTVPRKPARAGIDPHSLLIDAKPENNVVEVETDGKSLRVAPSGQGAKPKKEEVAP